MRFTQDQRMLCLFMKLFIYLYFYLQFACQRDLCYIIAPINHIVLTLDIKMQMEVGQLHNTSLSVQRVFKPWHAK